jgi:hypothetical protein
MWRKMPKGQLAKCAEALALRKAYPDLADIYTDDEMLQADDNHAPSGRAMTIGAAPAVEGTKEAAQAVAARIIAEHDALEAQRAAEAVPLPKAVIPQPGPSPERPVLDAEFEEGTREPGDDRTIAAAVIESIKETKTRDGKAMLQIRWNGRDHGCFYPDLFKFLLAGKGLSAQLIAEEKGKYSNITGILKIGRREFEEGKVPILDVNEPRPTTVQGLY